MKSLSNWLKTHPLLSLAGAVALALAIPSSPTKAQSIAGFAAAGPGLVPFVAEIPGGLANSAGVGSANPEILIDSDGEDGFLIVNSILLRTNVQGSGDFQFLRVNTLTINGTEYDTRTPNLVGPLGSGVNESADLMGTPIRTDSSDTAGGCFPTTILAQNAGVDPIEVRLFARADVTDLNVSSVRVSGWKRAADTVSVTWVPGN